MNAFTLLITTVIVGALLYFVGTTLLPIFQPETNVQGFAESLLLEAQSDLGHAKSVTLTLKTGQGLFARTLDEPTRTVATACASASCCPEISGCTQPLSADGERILVHANVKTTLTARCLASADIHACKLYVGGRPPQVEITHLTIPTTIEIPAQPTLEIQGVIQNTGDASANGNTFLIELLDTQARDTVIDHLELPIPNLLEGESTPIHMSVPIQRTGSYTVRVSVYGTESGKDERLSPLAVTGTETSTCFPDLSKEPEKTYDSFQDVCRTKLYCEGCTFAYECRSVWSEQSPATGSNFYDENRGEPGFTYLISPAENGTC